MKLFPTPENVVPDYCGPLVGYRWWSIVRDTDVLWSLTGGVPWLHGKVLEAADDGRGRPGIYAYKSLDGAWTDRDWTGALVLGRVAFWGTVIEHEHGYRAEYAYPLDFLIARGGEDVTNRLTRAYSCGRAPAGDVARAIAAAARDHWPPSASETAGAGTSLNPGLMAVNQIFLNYYHTGN